MKLKFFQIKLIDDQLKVIEIKDKKSCYNIDYFSAPSVQAIEKLLAEKKIITCLLKKEYFYKAITETKDISNNKIANFIVLLDNDSKNRSIYLKFSGQKTILYYDYDPYRIPIMLDDDVVYHAIVNDSNFLYLYQEK